MYDMINNYFGFPNFFFISGKMYSIVNIQNTFTDRLIRNSFSDIQKNYFGYLEKK